MTPDDRNVLAANQGTKDKPRTTVSIIDTASFMVVGTVETGKGARGVVIDPSSRFAYITNVSPMAPTVAPSPEIELVLPADMVDMDMGG